MLHPLLLRQLARCGIRPEDPSPPAESLARLLERVSQAYRQGDEERYLMERSLALSSGEMQALNRSLRESERTLAAERDTLASVFRSLGEGLCVLDPQGRCTSLNPEGEHLSGWSEAELRGQPVFEVLLGRPAAPSPGERVRDEEATLLRRDGTRLPVSLVVDPIVRAGQPCGAVLVFRDTTEARRVRSTLERAREAALEAARIKSQFLANMSHEIRTPLNGVIGMAELLLDTELDADQRDCAATLRRSARHLLAIVDDVLDFSKLEAGRLELEAIPLDPLALAFEALEMFAEPAQRKGLEVACSGDPDLPASVVGDPARLRQVLGNLIGNAVKFTERGEIEVRVGARTEEIPAGLRFEVRDTGVGIPLAGCQRLFQAFSQADGSTTRRYGGTGLGLVICKQLATAMGGTVGIRSEVGRGSTFWIEAALPADAPPTGERPLQGLRAALLGRGSCGERALERALAALGAEVRAAKDAADAAAWCGGAQGPSCAILDAGADLQQAFAWGRAVRAASAAALVLICPRVAVPRREALAAEGFALHLVAPCRPARLAEALGAFLRSHAPAPALPAPRGAAAAAFGAGKRLLLAEDNEVNRRVAVCMLRKLGYEVDVAANGLEALEAVAHVTYDAVLMDCQMPELDGLETTRRLRAREQGSDRRLPVLALTANALPGDRERCLEAGMDEHVTKPIVLEELARTLERWLGAARP